MNISLFCCPFWRSRFFAWGAFSLFCLLLPWGVAWAWDIPRLMLQNFTDGAFYLGYAQNFRLLLEQIGIYYYMVRFPAFAPEALAITLGGPEALLFYRYVLAGLCCFAIGALLAVRMGFLAGLLGAIAWAVNPFALRLVQTAYSDVAGVSFALLGLCILCWPTLRWSWAFFAGVLLAAACWSHLHAAVALFFALPLVALMRWKDGWKYLVLRGGTCALGGLFLTAVAAAWYYGRLGMWDLLAPTLEVLEMLDAGGIAKPLRPWSEIFTQQTFWFVPIPLAWGAWVFRRDQLLLGAWVGLSAYIAFLSLHDWLKGGYSLSLFYYFSFAVPFVALVSASILAQGLRLFSSRLMGFAVMCILAVLPSALVAWWDWSLSSLLIGGAIGGVVVAAWALWKRDTRWVALWLVVVATSLLAGPSDGRLALGNYWRPDEWHLWQAAQDLGEMIEAERKPGERIRFWLQDAEEPDARMVQSFFLHAQTQWGPPSSAGESPPSYPASTPGAERSLREMGVALLVIMDSDPVRLQRAWANLQASGVRAQVVAERSWGGERPWLHTLILRIPRLEPLPQSAQAVALDQWQFNKRVVRKAQDDGWELRLRSFRGAVDVWMPLSSLGPDGEWDWIEVPVRVEKGAVLVELISDWEQPLDANSRLVVAGSELVRVLFTVDKPMPQALVRIRNFIPKGTSSEIWLGSIVLGRTQWPSPPAAQEKTETTQ